MERVLVMFRTLYKTKSGGSEAYGDSYWTGDTITCFVDFDNKTISFSKNGNNLVLLSQTSTLLYILAFPFVLFP